MTRRSASSITRERGTGFMPAVPTTHSPFVPRILQLALLSSYFLTSSAQPIFREFLSILPQRRSPSPSLALRQLLERQENRNVTTRTQKEDNTVVIVGAVLTVLIVLLIIITIFIYIRYYRPSPSSLPPDPEKGAYPLPQNESDVQRPPEIRVRRLKRFQNGNKVILHARNDAPGAPDPYHPPSTPKSPTPSHHRRNVQVMQDNMISIEPMPYMPNRDAPGVPLSLPTTAAHPSHHKGPLPYPRKPNSAKEPKVVRFPSQLPAVDRAPKTPVRTGTPGVEYEYGFERRQEGSRGMMSPMAPKVAGGRSGGSPFVTNSNGAEKLVQHKKAPSWL